MSIDNKHTNGLDTQIPSDWDAAIAEAKTRLAALERERARLKRAVQVFSEKRRSGEAWPSRSLAK